IKVGSGPRGDPSTAATGPTSLRSRAGRRLLCRLPPRDRELGRASGRNADATRQHSAYRTLDIDERASSRDAARVHLADLLVAAGGGAQPLIDGVRSFALEYLDALDRPVTTPDDVRTVVITLVTESIFDGPRAPVTVLATRVRLRNR